MWDSAHVFKSQSLYIPWFSFSIFFVILFFWAVEIIVDNSLLQHRWSFSNCICVWFQLQRENVCLNVLLLLYLWAFDGLVIDRRRKLRTTRIRHSRTFLTHCTLQQLESLQSKEQSTKSRTIAVFLDSPHVVIILFILSANNNNNNFVIIISFLCQLGYSCYINKLGTTQVSSTSVVIEDYVRLRR